jgi:acyl carrier protein
MRKRKYRADVERKTGFSKIVGCCMWAKRDGLEYAWIDSCCIDKRSSAELSEALNSMSQWYKNASRCYVYLAKPEIHTDPMVRFTSNRWFSRGWTLQELLAPHALVFLARDWTVIGCLDKVFRKAAGGFDRQVHSPVVCLPQDEVAEEISAATEIPVDFLVGRKVIGQACVAQRMYWASRRRTTRAEDRAYSLMGLFDINMPIIYGEGLEKAFGRLQREVIHRSPDQSIFAWYDRSATSHRLLATSPEQFRESGTVTQMSRSQSLTLETSTDWSAFAMSNLGLQITLPLSTSRVNGRVRYEDSAKAALYCVAEDSNGDLQRVHIDLIFLNNDLGGTPIFLCHRSRKWTFGMATSHPMNIFLCGNDYISALAEQKIERPMWKLKPKDIASRLVEILIDELDLPEDMPISNDVLLDDLDIDFLMFLTIGARIRDELSIDVGFDTLLKHRTVGDLKMFLISGENGLTKFLEHRIIAARRAHSFSDDPNC